MGLNIRSGQAKFEGRLQAGFFIELSQVFGGLLGINLLSGLKPDQNMFGWVLRIAKIVFIGVLVGFFIFGFFLMAVQKLTQEKIIISISKETTDGTLIENIAPPAITFCPMNPINGFGWKSSDKLKVFSNFYEENCENRRKITIFVGKPFFSEIIILKR